MTRAVGIQHSFRFTVGVMLAAVGLSIASSASAALPAAGRSRAASAPPGSASHQQGSAPQHGSTEHAVTRLTEGVPRASSAARTPARLAGDGRYRLARPTTRAASPGESANEEPIALGLASTRDDHTMMERFAKNVGAKAYHQVWGSWDEHRSPEEIYRRELEMMTKATVIHFNLSEIDWGKFLAWKQAPQAERGVAHTHHELEQVIKSPQLRAKTVFYMNGKKMNPCASGLAKGGVGSYVRSVQQMQSALCH